MKKVILSLIVLYSCAFQCDPGTGIYDTNFRDMELITGVQVRAGNNVELERIGNPNIKTSTIKAYPNPVNTIIKGVGPDIVRKMWFVPGQIEHNFQSVEFDIAYQDIVYPEADIEAARVRYYTPNSENFVVNVTDVPSGHYRVFYLLDNGELYWDNLYVDHERTFNESVAHLSAEWDN